MKYECMDNAWVDEFRRTWVHRVVWLHACAVDAPQTPDHSNPSVVVAGVKASRVQVYIPLDVVVSDDWEFKHKQARWQ